MNAIVSTPTIISTGFKLQEIAWEHMIATLDNGTHSVDVEINVSSHPNCNETGKWHDRVLNRFNITCVLDDEGEVEKYAVSQAVLDDIESALRAEIDCEVRTRFEMN